MIIYQMQTDRDFEKHAVNFQVLEDNNMTTIHSLAPINFQLGSIVQRGHNSCNMTPINFNLGQL